MNAQRIADYKNGSYELGGGVVDPLPENAPLFGWTQNVVIPEAELTFRELRDAVPGYI